MSRSALVILALVFFAELTLFALLPLVPVYADELHLSKLQAGIILSSSSLSVMVISIPAGILADRFGARRITMIAAGLLVVSSFGQAFAHSFETVLAARLVFGLGSASVWSSALAWLSNVSNARTRASTVGATVAVAGLGSLIGPVFAGYMAEHFSIRAAFIVIGVLTALTTAALGFVPAGTPHEVEPTPLRKVLGIVGRDRVIVAALLMMTVSGFVDGIVNLLAPLQLAAEGVAPGPVGVVLSLTAGVFFLGSAAVSRSPRMAASTRAAANACLIQAVVLIPVLITSATGAVVFVLLARSPESAVMYTVAMPIAVISARQRGIGTATVAGIVGVAWGFSSMVGPPIGGLLADSGGDRLAYLVAAVSLVASGLWLLRAVPEPVPEPEPVS